MAGRNSPTKQFVREVLVTVIGLTPQIITETLYALHNLTPLIKIDKIHIITTNLGKNLIEELLIKDGKGILYKFLKEYKIPAKDLKIEIHTLFDKTGRKLEDIRNTEDNFSVSNQIVSFIKRFTINGDTRLHCSVAGGRKTMSVYLAYALSLFGRPQDRLYHVLIRPSELEDNKGFFYKPNRGCVTIKINGKKRTYKPNQIKIELAEIPFVRFRVLPELDPEILKRDLSYTEIVALTQKMIDSLNIEDLYLNIAKGEVTIGTKNIILPFQQLAFYKYFITRKTESCKEPEKKWCGDCVKCFVLFGKDTKETIMMLNNYLKRETPKHTQLNISDIRSLISKINSHLVRALSITPARYYKISSTGQYGEKLYGVYLEKSKFHIT